MSRSASVHASFKGTQSVIATLCLDLVVSVKSELSCASWLVSSEQKWWLGSCRIKFWDWCMGFVGQHGHEVSTFVHMPDSWGRDLWSSIALGLCRIPTGPVGFVDLLWTWVKWRFKAPFRIPVPRTWVNPLMASFCRCAIVSQHSARSPQLQLHWTLGNHQEAGSKEQLQYFRADPQMCNKMVFASKFSSSVTKDLGVTSEQLCTSLSFTGCRSVSYFAFRELATQLKKLCALWRIRRMRSVVGSRDCTNRASQCSAFLWGNAEELKAQRSKEFLFSKHPKGTWNKTRTLLEFSYWERMSSSDRGVLIYCKLLYCCFMKM